jgi:hypothetical protein
MGKDNGLEQGGLVTVCGRSSIVGVKEGSERAGFQLIIGD